MVSAMQKRHLVLSRQTSRQGESESEEESTQDGYDGEVDKESDSAVPNRKKRAFKAKWKSKRCDTPNSQQRITLGASEVGSPLTGTPLSQPLWYSALAQADEFANRRSRTQSNLPPPRSIRARNSEPITDEEFQPCNDSIDSSTAIDLGRALQRLSTSADKDNTNASQLEGDDVEMAGPSNPGPDAGSLIPLRSSALQPQPPPSSNSCTSSSTQLSSSAAPGPLVDVTSRPEAACANNETSSSNPGNIPQSHPARPDGAASIPPAQNATVLGSSVAEVVALTETLKSLAHGLERVNATIEKQHALLSSKIDALGSSPDDRGSPRTSRKQGRDHPYQRAKPTRRKKSQRMFSSSIREHLDKLLDAHENPFVPLEESKCFEVLAKQYPGRRCCDSSNFQIDVTNGPHSRWNVSAALVFAEDYVKAKQVPLEQIDNVMQAFFTRVKSIKQFLTEKPERKDAKTQYGRKYGLFYRRFETVLAFPDLKNHQGFIQMLGVDGMSSDKDDGANSNNPSYQVLTPRWRSAELTTFLHGLDSLYIVLRRYDSARQRGNWPRPRRYDALHPKLSSKLEYPRCLPQNAYDQVWLNSFPNIRLSVNPTLPYNLTHSPQVFQHLLGMQGNLP